MNKRSLISYSVTGSPKRPYSQSKRHSNSSSRRRSGNAKDVLRRRHVVCQGVLGSPVRRSQRLAGQRTPVGVGVSKYRNIASWNISCLGEEKRSCRENSGKLFEVLMQFKSAKCVGLNRNGHWSVYNTRFALLLEFLENSWNLKIYSRVLANSLTIPFIPTTPGKRKESIEKSVGTETDQWWIEIIKNRMKILL